MMTKLRRYSKLAMRGGRPRMALKTGAHGTDCGGLCDKGEPGFFIRGDFFWYSFVWQTKEY
jgi:hypothetical protein